MAEVVTAANVNDVTQLLALVDRVPPVKGKPGRPKRKPAAVYADRGYDSEPLRHQLRTRGIRPYLAKRGHPHGSGLGVYRWVVERTLSWLHGPRRLRIRYERRPDIHEAFVKLGFILICWTVYCQSLC